MNKGLWHAMPAVPVFLSTMAGISAAFLWRPAPAHYAIFFGCLLCVLWARRYGFVSRRIRLHWVIAAVVASLLLGQQQMKHTEWAEAFVDGDGQWQGLLLPSRKPDGATEWRLRLTAGQGPGRPYMIVAESDFAEPLPAAVWDELADGAVVRVSGAFRAPARSGNPGEFDYRRHLYMQNVVGTLYTDGIQIVTHHVPFAIQLTRRASALRARMHQYIHTVIERYASPLGAQVMIGMVTGNTAQLEADVEAVFRRTGISHLLAVSGLHVGLVLALVLWTLKFVTASRWGRLFVAVAAVWAFVLLSGARPSAVRAGLMATLSLGAYEMRRQVEPLQFWALAGIVILLWQPLYLLQAGFQLSFAASGAILISLPMWRPLLGNDIRWYRKVWAGCGVSIAAQVGSTLPLAYHFNELSVVGLPINMAAVPLAGPVLALTVTGIILSGVSLPLGGLFLRLASFIINGVWPGLRWASGLKWAAVEVAAPSALIAVIWIAAWLGIVWTVSKQSAHHTMWGRRLLLGALLCATVAVWLPAVHVAQQTVRIMFIDVGQGDAILIQTAHGQTVLIDGGGNPRRSAEGFHHIGERRILPLLRHLGIKKVDVVINTHPDEDHLQGLVTVLEQRQVGLVLDSGQPRDTLTYAEYERAVAAAELPRYAVRRGHVILLDGDIELQVLHPGAADASGSDNANSVVIRLVTKNGTVLFTGDLPNSGQQELLWSAQNVNLQADIIKVPHHGSGRDVQWRFIDAVAPQVAVIQVGRNGYGHPAREAVKAYADRGAAVYRTDKHGLVTVILSRRGVQVRSYHVDATKGVT